jgi:hypothetical protein
MPREDIIGRLALTLSVVPLLQEQFDGELSGLTQCLTALTETERYLIRRRLHCDPAAALRQFALAMKA